MILKAKENSMSSGDDEKNGATNYEPRAERRRPPLKYNYQIPYDERLRGQRRERERNAQHIISATRHWDIARITLSPMAGENELLRGIYIAEQDQLLWWPARVMSHGEGLWVMKHNFDPDIHKRDITQVEINRSDLDELYLAWGSRMDASDAFANHPIHKDLVDGCLAVRGRPILRKGRRLRLASAPHS